MRRRGRWRGPRDSGGSLRIQHAERERRLAGPGHARNADDLPEWDIDIDILEIMDLRPADQHFIDHGFYSGFMLFLFLLGFRQILQKGCRLSLYHDAAGKNRHFLSKEFLPPAACFPGKTRVLKLLIFKTPLAICMHPAKICVACYINREVRSWSRLAASSAVWTAR